MPHVPYRSRSLHPGVFLALVSCGVALAAIVLFVHVSPPSTAITGDETLSATTLNEDVAALSALTRHLVYESAQYDAATGPYRQGASGALTTTARARATLLREIARRDPEAIDATALTPALTPSLSSAIQNVLETPAHLQGVFTEGHADDFAGQTARFFSGVTTADGHWVNLDFHSHAIRPHSGESIDITGLALPKGTADDQDEVLVSGITAAQAPIIPMPVAAFQTQHPPVATVPALNSKPGAPATLYLNFGGDSVGSWFGYTNIVIPPFDLDKDPTTFNASEVKIIQDTWKMVSEDYAPYNINVTTVAPSSATPGIASGRVDIGGDGHWVGGVYGGIAGVGIFQYAPPGNVVFIFPVNLQNSAAYMGVAASHESGHGFGLQHQSLYDATSGKKVQEYNQGDIGGLTAPIMGLAYGVMRSMWWYGTSALCPTCYQDDIAIIGSQSNGFGFTPDDAGPTPDTAIPLSFDGTLFNGAGLIGTQTDVDWFSFTLPSAGEARFAVTGELGFTNLKLTADIRDAGGSLIASSIPLDTSHLGAFLSVTLQPGTYYLVVQGNGEYGSVGRYTINNGWGVAQSSHSSSSTAGTSSTSSVSSSASSLSPSSSAQSATSSSSSSLSGVSSSTVVQSSTSSSSSSSTSPFSSSSTSNWNSGNSSSTVAGCVRSNPSVTVSSSGQNGLGGQKLAYVVTVKNMDSAVCGSSSFTLTPQLPDGWAQPAITSIVVAPGYVKTVNISITSPITAPVASYAIPETVTNTANPSYVGWAAAAYTVTCSAQVPVVSVTPQSQQQAAGKKVTYTVAVQNPSLCVSSTFLLHATVPGGWVQPGDVSVSLSPGQSASKSMTVIPSSQATPGSYSLVFTAANKADLLSAASAGATDIVH